VFQMLLWASAQLIAVVRPLLRRLCLAVDILY
jgi:hypothetical protein